MGKFLACQYNPGPPPLKLTHFKLKQFNKIAAHVLEKEEKEQEQEELYWSHSRGIYIQFNAVTAQ